jgi:acyl-CoA oxidase
MFNQLDEELPLGLHWVMFIPTLESQATPEQKQKWLPLARTFQLIGCYAQTEMGHGGNVRGLETTATYDKATQEFVLHSPTLSSTKWWPGGLGKTATHCVTHARLIIDGKDYGVHTFFAQLRSLEDHSPLPGITIGDIGPKFGYGSQDNGFLRFDHYRIPRENMLMKYKQVSPEGVYTEAPKEFSKVGYSTMVYIRASIVEGAARTLARACTIAIRYSAVRRQFSDEDGEAERQVLDYQMQQYRLLPLLATAYAFHFTGKYMHDLWENMKKGLESSDASALPEVHATSSGLKAYTTWVTSNGIEECRKCCGGHGYSAFSGLPELFANYVPACTYEGDNVVLCQQTARYLLKCLKTASAGRQVVGSVVYLTDKGLESVCPAKSKEDLLHPEIYARAFAYRARTLLVRTARVLDDLVLKKKMSHSEAWNAVMVDLIRMVRAHCFYTIVMHFTNALKTIPDADLRQVLTKLSALFALYYLEQDIGEFLEIGYLNSAQAEWTRENVRDLLRQIRADAVPLVDAWNFSDYTLNSSLGRYNGDCYEHMYAWAQKEPLNQRAAPPGYEEYLKPLLSGQVFQDAMQKRAARL